MCIFFIYIFILKSIKNREFKKGGKRSGFARPLLHAALATTPATHTDLILVHERPLDLLL